MVEPVLHRGEVEVKVEQTYSELDAMSRPIDNTTFLDKQKPDDKLEVTTTTANLPKKRGRPRKRPLPNQSSTPPVTHRHQKRGRPRKIPLTTLTVQSVAESEPISEQPAKTQDLSNKQRRVLTRRKQPKQQPAAEELRQPSPGPTLFSIMQKAKSIGMLKADKPIVDDGVELEQSENLWMSLPSGSKNTKKTCSTSNVKKQHCNPVPRMPNFNDDPKKKDELPDVYAVEPEDISLPAEPMETCCKWYLCKETFDCVDLLDKHVEEKHILKGQKKYVCKWKECHRGEAPFGAPYLLGIHMKQHTGLKPYKCHYPECYNCYSRFENLKTHIRTHTGERPYMCYYENCSKAFTNPSDRAKHVHRTHSERKRYHCVLYDCLKCYTDPSSVRKHINVHHGLEVWRQYQKARELEIRTRIVYKLYTDDSGVQTLVSTDFLLENGICFINDKGQLQPFHPRTQTPPVRRKKGQKSKPQKNRETFSSEERSLDPTETEPFSSTNQSVTPKKMDIKKDMKTLEPTLGVNEPSIIIGDQNIEPKHDDMSERLTNSHYL